MKSLEQLQSAYDRWHQLLEATEKTDLHLAPWHKVVASRVGDLRGKTVLEVGCGRGDFALWLARQGAHVVACDYSPSAIEIARKKAHEHGVSVNFRVEDAQALQLREQSFDVVISCETLEHVPAPWRMASELYRLCSRPGRCLLTTPSYLNGVLLAWAKAWLTGRPYNSGSGVQPHENFFLYFRVAQMLRQAGFKLSHMESWHFQFLLLPRCDPQKLAVPRFRHECWNRLFRPFGLHFCYDLAKV